MSIHAYESLVHQVKSGEPTPAVNDPVSSGLSEYDFLLTMIENALASPLQLTAKERELLGKVLLRQSLIDSLTEIRHTPEGQLPGRPIAEFLSEVS